MNIRCHENSVRVLPALVLAAALVLSACSDSNRSESTTEDQTADQTGRTTESSSVPMSQKPTVEIPDTPPPSTLQVRDITEGNGAEAKAGDTVTVQYVGVSYSTKKQFDASWDNGRPFSFPLGKGNVIKGWDEGVAGMKVGGRRELTIPPSLGYGAGGYPPVIAPNETLVFVVDLVSVD